MKNKAPMYQYKQQQETEENFYVYVKKDRSKKNISDATSIFTTSGTNSTPRHIKNHENKQKID